MRLAPVPPVDFFFFYYFISICYNFESVNQYYKYCKYRTSELDKYRISCITSREMYLSTNVGVYNMNTRRVVVIWF